MKMKFIFSCLVVFAASSAAWSQQVVYVCPEGTYETTFFGYRECKSLSNEPQRPKNESKSQALNAAETTLGLAMIGSKTLADAAKVLKDPRNKNYENGQWIFDEPKTGEFCAANFLRRDTGVMVLGPGGAIPGAFLIFYGPKVPKSKEIAKIKVTLTQTGFPPQTVQALNFTHPTIEDYGTIVFAVPSFEAGLSGTEDVHKFGVSVQGKSVIDIEWKAGLAARDKLRACAAQRAKE
jgi:hypothetical protein